MKDYIVTVYKKDQRCKGLTSPEGYRNEKMLLLDQVTISDVLDTVHKLETKFPSHLGYTVVYVEDNYKKQYYEMLEKIKVGELE